MFVNRFYCIVWIENNYLQYVSKYCKYLGQIFCICNFKWNKKNFQKAKYNIIFLLNISLKVRKYDKAELPQRKNADIQVYLCILCSNSIKYLQILEIPRHMTTQGSCKLGTWYVYLYICSVIREKIFKYYSIRQNSDKSKIKLNQ